MYLRNLTYPRMMLGTPTNSTVSMIAGTQKGVTITAQEGRQDCFVQMWFNAPRDTSLVFQTDIWNVVGDQSTVRNGYVLIAELDPWKSLCSAANTGRISLKFTPTRDFIIRLACPDSGSANFTQPLLMTEAEWNELHALGEGYFDGDLMPLTNGGGEGVTILIPFMPPTLIIGGWPHDADNQPLPQPVVQLAWGIALPVWRFRHHNLHRRAAATATAVDRRWRRAGGTGVDRTAGIDAHGVPVLLLDVRQVAAQRMPVHHRQHGLRLDGAGPWRQPAVQWRPRHGDDRVHHPAGCQWNPDRVRQSPENGRGDGVRPAHAHDQNRLGLVAEEQSRQAALRRSHATQLTAHRLAVAA